MSHEGIRIVSAEDAAREENTPQPTGAAIQPAKITVDKTGGTGMTIEWRDGHRSEWNFAFLRAACPCATCHEAREAAGLKPGQQPAKPSSLLPMYSEPARPRAVTPVGKYALRFTWNDGHEAGLYSWEYLRRISGQGEIKTESDEN
jgi:DUF971 family protein